METWRPIPDYDGYEVSDLGRVRSWRPRNRNAFAPTEPRILKPGPTGNYGHVKVNLFRDKKVVGKAVHVLVALTFLGPRPEGHEVCHNDGNPANNQLSNLRYGTCAENAADKMLHGTVPRGETSRSSKLTEEKTLLIRKLYESGDYTQIELARRFGVSQQQVSTIVRRKAWAHI